jgi:hypothetical protein
MTRSSAAIVPITLTVNGRTGITLWAPPWEDDDGEEWQGFLGDGAKILLYPHVRELAAFIASGEENDLSDHPAWGYVLKMRPDDLRPGGDDSYDLDMVYEWASGEPDPVHVSALANVVDMVARIADSCDDGALRRLVENTPAYEVLVDEENTYQGRDGRKRWNELGDTISETWERAIARVESWLSWQGDFTDVELESETLWERVGAEPITIVLPDATYLTVRGEVTRDAAGDETEVAFIGSDDTVAVFTEVADLARYCRVATEHRLEKLERWNELAEVDQDDLFAPAPEATYDLSTPNAGGAELLGELIEFCNVDIDASVLDGPAEKIDRDDWAEFVRDIRSCLREE